MRNYTIFHIPGTQLTFEMRLRLAKDWNECIRSGRRTTIRAFARAHGLSPETWRREYLRGAVAVSVPDVRDRRRRIYAEYDPFMAQDRVNDGNGNKGPRMRVTGQMAAIFRRHVVEERLSPYEALRRMEGELPGQRLPCLSTMYGHIHANDIGVRRDQTPYRARRRPRGPRPHPAMAVPGRLQINDRPCGAARRSRFGHYEMDTVVSGAHGRGGLLVLVDRKSRRYVIEPVARITQDDVVLALGKMVRRGAIAGALSVTTDNGCEFLDPDRIGRTIGCSVYYTRAYASWEKGSVENCNRFVRRWYPKGTDFSKFTRADAHRLERVINSMHRRMLGGRTAYERDTAYARRVRKEDSQ